LRARRIEWRRRRTGCRHILHQMPANSGSSCSGAVIFSRGYPPAATQLARSTRARPPPPGSSRARDTAVGNAALATARRQGISGQRDIVAGTAPVRLSASAAMQGFATCRPTLKSSSRQGGRPCASAVCLVWCAKTTAQQAAAPPETVGSAGAKIEIRFESYRGQTMARIDPRAATYTPVFDERRVPHGAPGRPPAKPPMEPGIASPVCDLHAHT